MTISVPLLFLLLLQSLHHLVVAADASSSSDASVTMNEERPQQHSNLRAAGHSAHDRSLQWRGPLDNRYKSTKLTDEEKKRLDLYPPDYVFVDENAHHSWALFK